MTAEHARREVCVLAAFTATAALALTYLIAVRTPLGQRLDTHVMLDVSRALSGQTWMATVLGLVSPAIVFVIAAAIVALAGLRRGLRVAVVVLATAAGTVVGAALLKAVLTRPGYVGEAANSLPSGHVAAVAGLAVAATMAVSAPHRFWIGTLGAAATGITGVATLALQWHRPSDVLAATLIALAAGALAAAVQRDQPSHQLQQLARERRRSSSPSLV